MKKLTFKQYLESKEQLKKVLEQVPVTINEYVVCNYCSIPVGEKDEHKSISLKPKHRLIIEWRYDNIDNPTPVNIQFKGVNNIDDLEKFPTYWEGKKLSKWLMRHTRKER